VKSQIIKEMTDQLTSITDTYKGLQKKAKYDDLSDLGDTVAHNLISRSIAGIERVSGQNSAYSKHVQAILERKDAHDFGKLSMIIGTVDALLNDIQSGYLSSATDLLHGEIFGDFLEMAGYLFDEGYKDAAAVISGSTLESHLRHLCVKNNIPVEINTAKGVQAKRADLMNSDLANVGTISKLDQKSITAWLDLRNKAAHGKYDEYTKEQVALLIAGIRDFVIRNPA
jgi:hypothetical protein